MLSVLLCALASLGSGPTSDECANLSPADKAKANIELPMDMKALASPPAPLNSLCLYADEHNGVDQLNTILVNAFSRLIPKVELSKIPFKESCPYTVMYRVYSAGADINGIRLFAFYKGLPIMSQGFTQKQPITVDRFFRFGQSFILNLKDNPFQQIHDRDPEKLTYPEAYDRLDGQVDEE